VPALRFRGSVSRTWTAGGLVSYGGTVEGMLVTVRIDGAHPKLDYPLLPGDLLLDRGDGTYGKFGPGLGIEGFELTPEQVSTLKPSGEMGFQMGGFADFAAGESA
jgi:hypothetical protein